MFATRTNPSTSVNVALDSTYINAQFLLLYSEHTFTNIVHCSCSVGCFKTHKGIRSSTPFTLCKSYNITPQQRHAAHHSRLQNLKNLAQFLHLQLSSNQRYVLIIPCGISNLIDTQQEPLAVEKPVQPTTLTSRITDSNNLLSEEALRKIGLYNLTLRLHDQHLSTMLPFIRNF